MIKIYLCLFTVVLALTVMAQSPDGINYQTVLRNGDGEVLPYTQIWLKISILSDAPDGIVVYSELHNPTTNGLGLVNFVIGDGIIQSGNFDEINWGADAYYLETAIELVGSKEFQVLGVSQFLSVPYSLYSKEVESLRNGTYNGEMLFWSADEWEKIPPGMQGQTLVFCDSVPTWGGCLPIILTLEVNVISFYLASSGGNVINDGGNPVFQRGICWSTSPNPTIENNLGLTQDGNGTGIFESTLNGLVAETNYYIRAYAITSKGVGYGQEIAFTTLPDYFTCGDILIDERDSMQYSTVQIGNQCWMAENLAYLPIVYPGEQGSSNLPFYYVFDYFGSDVIEAKVTQNYKNYGVLYNWIASLSACPEGWHLPSDDDYNELGLFLGGTTIAGGKMKSILTTPAPHPRWESPNTGATNQSGFNALPGGYRHVMFHFRNLGNVAFFRTSSFTPWAGLFNASNLNYDSSNLSVSNPGNDPDGYSIRCIKD